VSPARSAVLRQVLIKRVSKVRNTINISPTKGVGQSLGINVSVRKRRFDIFSDCMSFHDLSNTASTSFAVVDTMTVEIGMELSSSCREEEKETKLERFSHD